MRLSTKSRYGVRALFDMAYTSGNLPVQIKDISRRQKISPRYLEQIFQDFKKAGILKSKKGRHGGYYFAKAPEQITVREILEAAEGDILLVDCSDEKKGQKNPCKFNGNCVTQTVWLEASERLAGFFSQTTLQTLCEKAHTIGIKQENDPRIMYYI